MSALPLVIYHAGCWDGFCAAWVARKALGEIEATPAHYGTPPPDVAFHAGEVVGVQREHSTGTPVADLETEWREIVSRRWPCSA